MLEGRTCRGSGAGVGTDVDVDEDEDGVTLGLSTLCHSAGHRGGTVDNVNVDEGKA